METVKPIYQYDFVALLALSALQITDPTYEVSAFLW
jgi:hypothetical protein